MKKKKKKRKEKRKQKRKKKKRKKKKRRRRGAKRSRFCLSFIPIEYLNCWMAACVQSLQTKHQIHLT
jgi:hypothetical protein